MTRDPSALAADLERLANLAEIRVAAMAAEYEGLARRVDGKRALAASFLRPCVRSQARRLATAKATLAAVRAVAEEPGELVFRLTSIDREGDAFFAGQAEYRIELPEGGEAAGDGPWWGRQVFRTLLALCDEAARLQFPTESRARAARWDALGASAGPRSRIGDLVARYDDHLDQVLIFETKESLELLYSPAGL